MAVNNIRSILFGRAARNIYFWIIVILFLLVVNVSTQVYPGAVYIKYKLITTAMLIAMTYCNNLVLIPAFLKRRKYWLYVLAAALLVLVTSLFFVIVMKHMVIHYPKIYVNEVSLVTSPVSTGWGWQDILEDMIVYAFGLALWLITFTMAWYMNEYGRQERLALAASQKHREAELHLLRNQLNPHFLFNTLNNIYGLTLKKSDVAPEAVLKLSSLMRYMLYDTEGKLIAFVKEKEMIEAYIEMEKLRLQNTHNMHFSIAADRDYMIPPLLWMPVLENVFKHGTRMIADDYYINFSFTIENSILNINSENTYKQENGKGKVGGVGLENLRRRLNILYPDKHSIEENITDNKYSITIKAELN